MLQGRVEVEAAVDVDGRLGAVAFQDVDDCLDTAQVIRQVGAADLHLDDVVARVEEAALFVLKVGEGPAGGVVAAAVWTKTESSGCPSP
ncbi:hypothetical protein OHT57_45135 [Streptomyces sp. NBC_00285]|uniref:hypothetical protein n=1 Tax=Streptomyces sp. NBC_00285 TaxID=2975700 RepID=UPI002E2D7A3F|nr:hypothetical protein [Streptomyces sp. NBC_00285]